MKGYPQAITREIERIRRLPWSAHFYKTIETPTVVGGKVDMYLLIDDDTGEGLVGLSVPHGSRWIAEYVAACCADPYFVHLGEHGDTAVAIALNQALQPFVTASGDIDGREVHYGAMTLIEAYVRPMAKRARQELIDNTISVLTRLRNQE